MENSIEKSNQFWQAFTREPLYDCGIADFVTSGGATTAKNGQEIIIAMAYLKGAADMARIANVYMSPSWQIANLLGVAAGTIRNIFESYYFECKERSSELDRVTCVYVNELKALLQIKG